ncbi:hypothetical protein RYZ26_09190 [Terasakiella sp. A23]|uniref:DUF1127 domain-containing protein n=1 Tax=Terasakiella sp. FCG-A23 TaxID=3080561 RepID=UPI0029545BC0|nr:hypothetical protein [Terasakiella sp. A23]MDV7339765.1 hypothetical protein [Terasakiella sp. A23]
MCNVSEAQKAPMPMVKLAFPTGIISKSIATALRMYGRASQRRQLQNLDVYRLNDLGLTQEDVARECAKPFWK